MEITTAHIMVTSLCDRDCKYCCNKQYDLNSIPYITDEELKQMKHIYLTGGEPFIYSNPCNIAQKLKSQYKNIERVIVYTNAMELYSFLHPSFLDISLFINSGRISHIDGVTISIKEELDKRCFEEYISRHDLIRKLPYNRVYVFPGFENLDCGPLKNFEIIHRKWQEKFVPAPNCIFRKL